MFRQAIVNKGRNRDTTWFAIIDVDWKRGLQDAYLRWLDPANFDAAGRQKLRLSELTAPFVGVRFGAGLATVVAAALAQERGNLLRHQRGSLLEHMPVLVRQVDDPGARHQSRDAPARLPEIVPRPQD